MTFRPFRSRQAEVRSHVVETRLGKAERRARGDVKVKPEGKPKGKPEAEAAEAPKQEHQERQERPPLPAWDTIAGLRRSKIADIARRRVDIDEHMAALKVEKDELNQAGVRLMFKAGVKSVLVDDRPVTRMDGMSTHLSRTKLFELGVSEEILERATTRTPYTTLLVGKPRKNRKGRS